MAPRTRRHRVSWAHGNDLLFLDEQQIPDVNSQLIVQNYAKGAGKHSTMVRFYKKLTPQEIRKLFPRMDWNAATDMASMSLGFFTFECAKHQKGFAAMVGKRQELHRIYSVGFFHSTPKGSKINLNPAKSA